MSQIPHLSLTDQNVQFDAAIQAIQTANHEALKETLPHIQSLKDVSTLFDLIIEEDLKTPTGFEAGLQIIVNHLQNPKSNLGAENRNTHTEWTPSNITSLIDKKEKEYLEKKERLALTHIKQKNMSNVVSALQSTAMSFSAAGRVPILKKETQFKYAFSHPIVQKNALHVRTFVRHLTDPRHVDAHGALCNILINKDKFRSMSRKIINTLIHEHHSQEHLMDFDECSYRYLKLSQLYLNALETEQQVSQHPARIIGKSEACLLKAVREQGGFHAINIENSTVIDALYYGSNSQNPNDYSRAVLAPAIKEHGSHEFTQLFTIAYGYKNHMQKIIIDYLKKSKISDEKICEFRRELDKNPKLLELVYDPTSESGWHLNSNGCDPETVTSLENTLTEVESKNYAGQLMRAYKKYQVITDYTAVLKEEVSRYKGSSRNRTDLHASLKRLDSKLMSIKDSLSMERSDPLTAFVGNLIKAICELASRPFRGAQYNTQSLWGSRGRRIAEQLEHTSNALSGSL